MSIFKKTISVLCAIASLILFFSTVISVIYTLTQTSSIGIIGGADAPTITVQLAMMGIYNIAYFAVFYISLLGFNTANILSVFFKKFKTRWWLFGWGVFNTLLLIGNISVDIPQYLVYSKLGLVDIILQYLPSLLPIVICAVVFIITTVLIAIDKN